MEEIRACLQLLVDAGYTFKSITIDDKRGFKQLLERMFPGVPIQLCHFHQKAAIRRYITNRPKSLCGKELRALTLNINNYSQEEFAHKLHELEETHKEFLYERNFENKLLHTRIIAAIRSLKTNMKYIYAYKNHPDLGIPHTTNILEGKFSHLKQNVNIHRGLQMKRKKILISNYLSRPH